MRNRTTLASASIVVVIIAASSVSVPPGRAQTAAQAKATPQAKADECLARPGTTTPKGSHWFYRIERPSNRRCWYLGPAGQKVRAERAARTERAIPIPAPAPAELRADEQARAHAPAAATSATAAAPAAGSAVAATQFSAAWPAASNVAATSTHDVPTVGSHDNTEAAATAAEPPAQDAAIVWPATSASDGAAAQPSAPGVLHLVIFLSAVAAFVAIAFRAVLKLASVRRGQRERRPAPRPAGPIIRTRAPELRAAAPSIEAMSEPAIARLREIARRWEAPTRVPRQPRQPALEVEPEDYRVEGPALRRQRVA